MASEIRRRLYILYVGVGLGVGCIKDNYDQLLQLLYIPEVKNIDEMRHIGRYGIPLVYEISSSPRNRLFLNREYIILMLYRSSKLHGVWKKPI